MTAPHLSIVPDAGDLPEYPLDAEFRIRGHFFVPMDHARYLGSRFCLRADDEVQGLFLRLVMLAQQQRPVGTLPRGPGDLAALLRVDPARFDKLCALDFGPLYGWRPCRCDDEIRLFHPVVLEGINFALGREEARALSREGSAARKRKERLKKALLHLGCDPKVAEDEVLMERLEGWLQRNVTGDRTTESYQAALVAARQQRWI